MPTEHNIGKIESVVKYYYSYTWTIDNFCIYDATILMSPEFTTGPNNENTWFIELEIIDIHVSIRLILKDTTVNAKVEDHYTLLSVINTEKQKTYEGKERITFFNLSHSQLIDSITDQNKQLTILCEIICNNNVRKINKHRDSKLRIDFDNLFEDPKYSDAQIVVGEKTFHVHKAIIVSRSLWFKAAFEGGMKEQQENKVTISNYDYEIVREMLRFIYTGQVKGTEDFVDRLFDAAVFYQLDKLKAICLNILSDNLSLENVFQTLYLADVHKEIDLKKKALEFIALHTSDLVDVEIKFSNVKKCEIDK